MGSLVRLFPFVWPLRYRLVMSAVLAVVAAVLTVVALLLVFPVVKLLLEGKGLHEYIADEQIAVREVIASYAGKLPPAVTIAIRGQAASMDDAFSAMAYGLMSRGEDVTLLSHMNDGGVVFADGMEEDRLEFSWGKTLRVSIADKTLNLVSGS